jgi:hypothetical protein
MSTLDNKKLTSKELKVKIAQIQEEIQNLVKENKTTVEIEMILMESDSDFYERYPYLVKKLVKGGDLQFLDKMLDNIEKIEEGEQTQAATELKLGEELANKFLYPVVKKE